ncbi:UNVERIFIED_ORG: hypothetical protein GGD48_006489 [Rhizobium etli]|uniref:hypothetical protein n=1 Tax=Rhizobium sophoriradicis TaxID=1535245 RepID=UPI00142DEEDA|nr:hypothetical protein [Rhizobium sophoriradicis]
MGAGVIGGALQYGSNSTPPSVIPGLEPLLSVLNFPFLNAYKTNRYWEIGIDFIVRDAG